MEHHGFQYKAVQHFEHRSEAHFLTFSCHDRRPLLAVRGVALMLAESLARAVHRNSFDLLAFVFMPEHVHILVLPLSRESSISRLLWGIKRPTAFRAKGLLVGTELVAPEAPFHLWQSGPGFDSNVRGWDDVLSTVDYIHTNPVKRGLRTRPEDYRWSSARQWSRATGDLDVGLPQVRVTR